MSEDEVFVSIAAAAFALIGWVMWVVRAAGIVRMPSRASLLPSLAAFLGVAAVAILVVLRLWSDSAVRLSPTYQFMYFLIGLAWIKAVEFSFEWGGLSVRDDVVERGNRAAVPAIGGALIGAACAYAGANIGDGPGWWVVIISAVLSTTGLAAVWAWLTRLTPVIDAITIDRDVAAGVRFGGLIAACGAISGRAVAGNWHGIDGLITDFLVVAPAMLPLLVVAILIERAARPVRERPHPPVAAFGIAPALLYIGAATSFLLWLGAPK